MTNTQPAEQKKIFGITISGGSKKGKQSAPVVRLTAEDKQNFVYTPTSLPLVNVIPQSFVEKYQVKGIVRKFVFAGIGVAATLALVFAGGQAYLATLQGQINALSQEQSQLTAQITALQPYQVYQVAVDSKRQALLSATSEDVNMGVIYQNVNNSASNNNVSVQSLAVVQYEAGAAGTECTNPDPFNTIVSVEKIIGCVTIQGGADNKDQVNTFLRDLEGLGDAEGETYRNPFISSFLTASNDQGSTSTFAATISFTSALYTDKYSDLAISLAELIAAGGNVPVDNPPAEEPAEEPVAELPEPGVVGEFVLGLVPDMTPEDVRTFDTISYTACITEDSTAAGTALTGLLSENYPNVDATTVIPGVIDLIFTSCEQIIATEEANNSSEEEQPTEDTATNEEEN